MTTLLIDVDPHEDGEHCGKCPGGLRPFYWCQIFRDENGCSTELEYAGGAPLFFCRCSECLVAERRAKELKELVESAYYEGEHDANDDDGACWLCSKSQKELEKS